MVLNPSWDNFLYWLIVLSLIVWGLELVFPWRKNQAAFRKGFWKDIFYMFFNMFLFSLIFFNALSDVGVALFEDALGFFGLSNIIAIELQLLPNWLEYIIIILVVDFVQWLTHILMHRWKFLWSFHKVHHSVKEMGFAAHLRYHWMENVVYKTNVFIALSFIGYGVEEFFFVHVITLAIGHLNHANLNLDYGPLKYIFNNPKMHIWHHAKTVPSAFSGGVNFAISFSFWDYIFRTAHIPKEGRDIELGFEGEEALPQDIGRQLIWPLKQQKIDN